MTVFSLAAVCAAPVNEGRRGLDGNDATPGKSSIFNQRLCELEEFAIMDLMSMISQAVQAGDENLVTRLDAVLRRIEALIAAHGELSDEERH